MAILRTASIRGASRLDARGWLRSWWREGPEQWVWPVSLGGWAVLLWGAIGWYPLSAQIRPALTHHHIVIPLQSSEVAAPVAVTAAAGSHLVLWIAMLAATMLPLIAHNLRTIGLRSPRPRRTAATLEVASGWAAVWMAAGAAAATALVVASAVLAPWTRVAVVGSAAVLWQFTRVKGSAVARCHRTLAPPLGPSARPVCLRFGVTLGWASVLGCWPSMALMAVSGHNVLVVVVLSWLSWRDMRMPHNRPGRWTSAAVLLGVIAFLLVFQP